MIPTMRGATWRANWRCVESTRGSRGMRSWLILPLRHEDAAAVEGELEPPCLHDHLQADAQLLALTHYLIHGVEVVSAELVEA